MKNTLVLGMMDGVHLGHQALLLKAKEIQRQYGAKTYVVSLKQHPAAVFGKTVELLTTNEEKQALISKILPAKLELIDFSPAFATLSPKDYIEWLHKTYQPSFIVIGNNHTFGKNAAGTPKDLIEHSAQYGYKVFVVPPVAVSTQHVSSTAIRQYIKSGDIQRANELLGYNYTLSGEVVKGEEIGRTLGFPTANIQIDAQKLLPQKGVYATVAKVDGKTYPAMTNIGTRPTVSNAEQTTIETHILNFDGQLYGKVLKIQFLKKVRDEIKFTTREELENQLYQDSLVVSAYIDNIKKGKEIKFI